MPRSDSLGQFEQLVLTAIHALREDAYGVTIHSKVQELARPKAVSLGAVYITLDRLEDKGMVSSWLSDPTPERGGRAKRCYRLEGLGERALEESAATAKRVGDAVAYDDLSLAGELADGRLLVRESALKSPALTMAANGAVDVRHKTLDVKVLSHPLSTIDKAVQAVPVVRQILTGDFLTVAAEVKGPFADPKVSVTPARDVGRGLVNIMERTVALPVKVLDPKSQ